MDVQNGIIGCSGFETAVAAAVRRALEAARAHGGVDRRVLGGISTSEVVLSTVGQADVVSVDEWANAL